MVRGEPPEVYAAEDIDALHLGRRHNPGRRARRLDALANRRSSVRMGEHDPADGF